MAGARPPAFALRAVPASAMQAAGARHAWAALAACAAEPNPFLEDWYLLPALDALDPDGAVMLLRFEADGDLAGLIPVTRARRYFRWPFPHLAAWHHANAFLGAPLVAAGLEKAFWRALRGWADRHAGAGLFLPLPALPLEGPLARALGEVLREQHRAAGLVQREERAMLASPLSPEAYLAQSMTGKKRKELRGQQARLGELGALTFERSTDDAGLDGWIADFLALEAAGWKGKAGSAMASARQTAALFRQALRGAAMRGRLERLALRLDGRPVAMLANFITPPGAFSFKTAFDEDFARFSPGVLLQCENLQVLDRPDIAWSDSCASADHPMIDRIWRERRAVGRLSVAIGGRLRRAAFRLLLDAELARLNRKPPA